ncbi:MAG: adenylate kinase [Chloroflexi bacterium]|nr:adenylate kinase [Chloroflexota bacterium]
MAKYLVLFGPPGVGKGTQAERLREEFQIAHVATGDLFRDNLKRETELGQLAKSYMDRGALVPDEVTIGMVRERLKEADTQNGVLFDGFPRTVAQAEALDKLLGERGGRIEKVLFIHAPEDVLLDRLGNRWTCKQCGAVYNLNSKPPKVAGVCDACGGELYQRPDDNLETQKKRIEVYAAQTAPLIDYFDQKGRLARIDGQQPIEKVTADVRATIG